jgi:tRNA (guanine-N7-)-methyltransferase
MTLVRVRQHVNPLSHKYQALIAIPDWTQIYKNLDHPMHLDIGCARGQFLLDMAQAKPDWNFLGVEIREPLVQRANEDRNTLGLKNLHYLFCNINVSLVHLFKPAFLDGVSIQFPDPWFKKRHQKRRVVEPKLVETLAQQIKPNGFLFIQSDVLDVAQQMRTAINAHPAFSLSEDSEPWLLHNPLPIPTERELHTLSQDKPVYRCWFTHRAIA